MSKGKILIVEDDEALASELKEMLTELGFEIAALADNGEDAIIAASETTPDLVLMDIKIKGKMDGIDTAEKLYNVFHIPVVYLTALSDPAMLDRARLSMPYGYVLKPFRDNELVMAIEIAFQQAKAEKALSVSNESLGDVIHKMLDGVIILNSKNDILFMNAAAKKMAGFLHPEFIQQKELFLQNLDKGHGEIEIFSANPQKGIAEYHRGKISWEGKDVYLILLRDITEKKAVEKALGQGEKLKVLGKLAAGVAHDFNNLLTVILGYSDVILETVDKESPLYPLIMEVKRAGASASSLTRQLLVFGRQQQVRPVKINLSSLLASMQGLLKGLAKEGFEFHFNLEPDLKAVMIDPGQMEQVILNLVVNARDAMKNGGKIALTTQNLQLENEKMSTNGKIPLGDYVSLRVTDSGHGMDEETKSRIFEPFFTTKDRDKGTGLGLSTVYGIVTHAGGFMLVESRPSMGTSFEIYLPAVG